MVSKHKANTPSAADVDASHPVNTLTFGDADQIATLGKLYPVYLANHVDGDLQIEQLHSLRVSYKYLYVNNWLHHFRGYLKLQSEYFDVDIFELELLNHFPAISASQLFNLEESGHDNPQTLLMNKLKLALISTVQNSKLSSINNFEKIFRLWFGSQTPLGGYDEDDEDEEDVAPGNEDDLVKFDQLLIADKYEILYILIKYITKYAGFRNWLDKNDISMEPLRMNPIYSSESAGSTVDYLFLFDNRLYKRTIRFNPLAIPKKRKLSPEYPEDHYKQEQFDIKHEIKFELVFKNVYEVDSVLESVGEDIGDEILEQSIVNAIFASEIKKRRYITNKRKEVQLVGLMATRKRSSRLEAKEKQRQEELRVQQLQEEEELKIAAEKRLERRRLIKEQHIYGTTNTHLTRDDRLRRRLASTPETTEPEANETPFEPTVSGVPAEFGESTEPGLSVEQVVPVVQPPVEQAVFVEQVAPINQSVPVLEETPQGVPSHLTNEVRLETDPLTHDSTTV